jgi:hypothetical protein
MNSVNKTCLIYGGGLLAVFVCAINFTILVYLTTSENTPRVEVVQEEEESTPWSDTCQRLMSHENGTWYHKFSDDIIQTIVTSQDTSIPYLYFPEELAWLQGENLPTSFGTCTPSDRYLMYNSLLGHQCGCGSNGFRPSHSVWVYNDSSTVSRVSTYTNPPQNNDDPDYFKSSSTLRLARLIAIANATLCFVGDSVDYQIYMAMHNNLRRMDQLHKQYHHDGDKEKEESGPVYVVMREIPVVHSIFEAGNDDNWFVRGRRPPTDEGHAFLYAEKPPPGGFGARSMHSILETKAFFKDRKFARIRYYMSYGEMA